MTTTTKPQDRCDELLQSRALLAHLRTIVVASSLCVLFMGGMSSAWAAKQDGLPATRPVLHLTGFSLHVGPGGFHLGIGVPHRYGYGRYDGFQSWGYYGGKRYGHRHGPERHLYSRYDRPRHRHGHRFGYNRHHHHDRGHYRGHGRPHPRGRW